MFLAWRQMLKVVDIPFTLIGALQIMWTYYHMNPKSMYIYYVSIQKHKCFKKIDKIDTKKKKKSFTWLYKSSSYYQPLLPLTADLQWFMLFLLHKLQHDFSLHQFTKTTSFTNLMTTLQSGLPDFSLTLLIHGVNPPLLETLTLPFSWHFCSLAMFTASDLLFPLPFTFPKQF